MTSIRKLVGEAQSTEKVHATIIHAPAQVTNVSELI